MKIVVFSHKVCWRSTDSPSGYATDGGFPMQMNALSELFDDTTIVVPVENRFHARGEMPLTGHNLRLMPLGALPQEKTLRRLFLPFWLVWNFPTMLREIVRADAVHTPIPSDVGTLAMLTAKFVRKRLFVRYCGNWRHHRTIAERFWKWFMERYAGGRNVMLATGGGKEPPSMRNSSIQWIFSTTMTASELHEIRIAKQVPPNRLSLVTVCRQEKAKGTSIVIEALPLLMQRFENVELHIAGDGAFLAELRRQAKDLNLNGAVTFHGKLNHQEVIGLMSRCDLFCYPTSSSEGFPKVVLEALACGLPVITTRVSVLPMLIGTHCGVLLEQPTAEHLADAVIRICSERETYAQMSTQALNVARDYSLENWGNSIRDILQRTWGSLRSQEYVVQ